jgi:diguanylate cyclase
VPVAVNLPSRLFSAPTSSSTSTRRDELRRAAPHDPARDHRDRADEGPAERHPALHRLNEIGVEISIDDFGTGYSSLAYLTTLPISELKIDRSFVRDLGITPQSSAVVTAIIALARSLGLRVIAEGVETLRQMEVLHRLGCGVMQGFLFSRPVPGDELERWLENTVLPRKAPWIGGSRNVAPADAWPPLAASLGGALQAALPASDAQAGELADRLARLAERIAVHGAEAAVVREVEAACADARRLFAHRHHLVDELSRLCRELTSGLVELAEDDSWVRGQCENLHARLAGGLSARSLRAAGDLLVQTRQRQQQLHGERNAARDALKTLVQRLLQEVGELDAQTGHFEQTVGRHAEAIERADTLAGVTAVVRELLDESRAVQALVHGARERLAGEHAKATELERRVRELEGELRRLSDEVTTDALTQVANRRGLALAFEAECARIGAADADADAGAGAGAARPLAVALIDIDNFKKLNDTLGHAAGDRALQGLAAAVRERLRPTDHLARFGGEEFVVLLPASPAPHAQQALTRLQRNLTESLFLHEGREVFVTFSAGVTAWRPGETLEAALERADQALYEAKRTGKNRTCMA